jgi:hypothetical protein
MDKNLLKEVPDTKASAIKRRLAKRKNLEEKKDK